MRKPGSPAWARCSGVAAALVSAAGVLASSVNAQNLPGDVGTVCQLSAQVATRASQTIVPVSPTNPAIGKGLVIVTNSGAEICANRLLAPQTIAVQPGIAVVATTGFTGAVLSRLDGVRGQAAALGPLASVATDGLMGLGRVEKSQPTPQPASPFTVYTMGTLLGGSRSDAPNLAGFGYDAVSAILGIEYSVNRNLIIGFAGNYTATDADLNSGATIDVSAIQLAVYLSYATKQWFVDALAAFGSHDLHLVRPGLTDAVIRSSTSGNAYALAARAGYLFDFGILRAGPIAGLTYIRSTLEGYTETGDTDLTFTVSSQTFDSLTSSVGIRFLASFRAGGTLIVPYLNVTWEHQFGDSTRVLAATLTQVPALPPILSSFPSFDTRDFGKIDAGITLQLGPDLSATVSGASTFARDEGHDFRVSTGLNFRF